MTSGDIRQKAREQHKQILLKLMPDLKPHEIEKLNNDAAEEIEEWASFAESLLSGGADSGTPAEATPSQANLADQISGLLLACEIAKVGDRTTLEEIKSALRAFTREQMKSAPPAASDLKCSECKQPVCDHVAQRVFDLARQAKDSCWVAYASRY